MTVNRPQTAEPAEDAAVPRLYLRDQELNQSAALIRAAARRLAEMVETSGAPASLSAPELEILQEIFDRGPLDVGELRHRLLAPKQSLARHLNDLETGGLLERRVDPGDRRRRIVSLTETGRVLTESATERRRQALREAFLEAGPEAVAGARRVLQDLVATRDQN